MKIVGTNGCFEIVAEAPEEIDLMNSCLFFVYQPREIITRFTSDNGQQITPVFGSYEDAQSFLEIIESFQGRIRLFRVDARRQRLELFRLLQDPIGYPKVKRARKLYNVIIKLSHRHRLLQELCDVIVELAQGYPQSSLL